MNCGSKYKVTPPESFYAAYENSVKPAEKSGPAKEQKPQNTVSFTLAYRAGMAAPEGMAWGREDTVDTGAVEGKADMGAAADMGDKAGSAGAAATKSVGILAWKIISSLP